MKKLLCVLAFTMSTLVGVQTSYAAAAVTGVSTLVVQLIQETTSLITMGSTLTNTASTLSNTSANIQSMLLNTVLKPMGELITQSILKQVSGDLISWAGGGFDGDPLIIADPSKFIQKAGMSQVKIALGQLPTDSIFGDSIFNSLVDTYKGANDLKSALSDLSKSAAPAMLQDSLCIDSKLTELAKSDVANSDGTYTQADLIARKNQIFNYACNGDPNTDPVVAKRLQNLQEQRPNELASLDMFYNLTVNQDNAYTSNTLAKLKIDKAAEDAKTIAAKEIFDGAGPISQKKCIKYAPTYAIGQNPECEQWQTLNPGELIQKSVGDAISAPLTRLSNITANGISDNVISAMLSSFALSSITKGINNAIRTATGGTPDNSPVVIAKRTTPSNDLLADPVAKSQYSQLADNQFVAYQDSLKKLNKIDTIYLSDINSYLTKITDGQTCYQKLVADGIVTATDPQVLTTSQAYQERLDLINPTKTKITDEMSKIWLALAFIDETNAKIKASNSSEEITTTTTNYLTTIDRQRYPQISDYAQREGDYRQDIFRVSQDKDIDAYQKTCTDIREAWTGSNSSNQNQGLINFGQ